ncbi:MAG: dipeptidase PepE [Planctomycetota bacterium]|jgi:dipeptidase E
MRLLLGSGGFRGDERRDRLVAEMQAFFGPIERLLFVPYAGHDHDGYVERMTEAGFHAGYELVGIHRAADPVEAVENCDGVYVGGGNTFRLIDSLHRLGLVDAIRRRVGEGLPYMGVSAGTNVACPTMMTTNDMPIVQPPSFDALGLVPFQVNAHYYPGQVWFKDGEDFHPHFGETRQDRIREFHECSPTPVVGLQEGGVLLRDGDRFELRHADAVYFLPGREAEEVPRDVDIGALLCR